MAHLEAKDFKNTLEVVESQKDLIQKGLFGGLPEEDLIMKGGRGSGRKSSSNNKSDREKHWSGMSLKGKEEYAEYLGNKKLAWNKKEIGLTKEDLAEITDYQKFIHTNNPEFDHYLTSQSGNESSSSDIKKAFESLGL